MEDYARLSLSNQFQAPKGSEEINFRNETTARDNVTSIEIRKFGITTTFPAKAEDNVAMAIAVLGVGRVTDDVEKRAQSFANDYESEEALLERAMISLRAAMLIRERNNVEEKRLTEDAYDLYKLVVAKEIPTLEQFSTSHYADLRAAWILKLETLRRASGSL